MKIIKSICSLVIIIVLFILPSLLFQEEPKDILSKIIIGYYITCSLFISVYLSVDFGRWFDSKLKNKKDEKEM